MIPSLSITGATPCQTHTFRTPRPTWSGVRFFLLTLYFCGTGCEEKFDLDLERYVWLARVRTDTHVADVLS